MDLANKAETMDLDSNNKTKTMDSDSKTKTVDLGSNSKTVVAVAVRTNTTTTITITTADETNKIGLRRGDSHAPARAAQQVFSVSGYLSGSGHLLIPIG